MRRIREVLRLKFQLGLSDVRVVLGARVARATVQDYLSRIAATGLGHEDLLALDDKTLDEKLFPPREARDTARPVPDWEAVEQQLRGRGVTLRLLWQEYQDGQTGSYARGPLDPESRARLERCADLIRDILLGRDR